MYFWSEGTQLMLHILLQFVWWPMNLSEAYNWAPNDHVGYVYSNKLKSFHLMPHVWMIEPFDALCGIPLLLCLWAVMKYLSMIELWLLLTFMVFDCILLKLPWSLIDIQLSTQHGDRKEQHSSNFWPNCAYARFYHIWCFDIFYHVFSFHYGVIIHPLCESSFYLWEY